MEKISAQNWETRLGSSLYAIVDFSSPGCTPCKPAAALAEEVVRQAQSEALPVAGYAVDITEEPALAQRCFVLSVPTIIVFKQGKEVGRFSGIPKKEKLRALLSK